MKHINLFSMIAFAAVMVACGNNNSNNDATAQCDTTEAHDCSKCESADGCITGKWTQPIPGQEGKVEGFELKKDGVAESINMATLQIEKWSKDSTTLTLTGKSIGNGQTIDFTETYTIAQGDKNSLTLVKDGSIVWALSKGGCCGDASATSEAKESGCCSDKAKAEQPKEEGCSGCGACEK